MGYIIYGKRNKVVNGGGPDKSFKALDIDGNRVTRKADAQVYETKELAQETIDSVGEDYCEFEIRKS